MSRTIKDRLHALDLDAFDRWTARAADHAQRTGDPAALLDALRVAEDQCKRHARREVQS